MIDGDEDDTSAHDDARAFVGGKGRGAVRLVNATTRIKKKEPSFTTRRHTRRQKSAKKTKRQRGFPDCSQSSTNAPQAGLSSLFRWGRLVFSWYERLMGDVSGRGVYDRDDAY